MNEIIPKKMETIEKKYIWGTEEWMLSDLHKEVEYTPLLVKIIEARDHLSLQVHPANEYAKEHENSRGKTEMWYVLDCEPKAFLYYGLKNRISQEEFSKRIKNDTILEVCRKVEVKRGDVFFIPAGMLHAIGKGIKVAEIQQNSNITYRIYDYHRKDAFQQYRPLHLKQAKEVLGFVPPLHGYRPMGQRIKKQGYYKTLLVRCPYFQVSRMEIEGIWEEPEVGLDQSLLILEGGGTLFHHKTMMEIKAGDSIYIPKGSGEYKIEGKMELLFSQA